jgi:hypothetical protein
MLLPFTNWSLLSWLLKRIVFDKSNEVRRKKNTINNKREIYKIIKDHTIKSNQDNKYVEVIITKSIMDQLVKTQYAAHSPAIVVGKNLESVGK